MDPIVAKRKYINTLCMIYIEAVNRVLDNPSVKIDFAVSNGIYTEILGLDHVGEDLLLRIKEEMDQIIDANHKIHKAVVPKNEAIEIFRSQGFDDKVKLLLNSSVIELPLYTIDSLRYNFVGGVTVYTGEIQSFGLYSFHNGLVLVHPNGDAGNGKSKDPCKKDELAYVNQEKLFEVFRESEEWGDLMKINTAGDLNEFAKDGGLDDIVLISEALHEKKIAYIADEIYSQKNVRVILIAGPSSSGKTTFAKRLGIQLRVMGKEYVSIGLDDYFIDRDKMQLDEKGEKNFDALSAIDLDLFAKDIKKVIAGEEVALPTFNFITGLREYTRPPLRVSEDTYIIVEGIHALNEKLTSLIDPDTKFRIYISALTQLNVDNHNRIPTTDLRLIRRIVRDKATRGHQPEATMAMWANVVDGESRNIFPYQENADVMFNSSLIYELSVLRRFAVPVLMEVSEDSAFFGEAKRLLRFLAFFEDCTCESYIPNSSILKEFIGGSCFTY